MDNKITWIILIVSVCCALAVSFICSLLEAALLSLTPSQLADLRRRYPQIGDVCRRLKGRIDFSLAVILMANTAAHTIGASVGGAKFEELFGSEKLLWFSIALTVVMVQYTELLPKTLGVRFNRQILKIFAVPLEYLMYMLLPLIKLTYWLNRPFELKKSTDNAVKTADEISALAALARSSQQISSRQERIIRSVPSLSDKTARDVMLPEENISMISGSLNIQEALDAVASDFHTRYPVCENGDRNRVIGYINIKELIAVKYSSKDTEKCAVTDIMRPINFSAPGDSAADLLERVVSQHSHLTIVRDPESGKTLGLVTQEDIVEELLGDMDDEFDPLPRTLYSPGENLWIVGGGVPMSLLARETRLELPRRMEPVAVWVARELKHLPRTGDVLRFGRLEFLVRKIRRGRVFELNIRRVANCCTPVK